MPGGYLRRARLALLAAVLGLTAACGVPVRVSRASPEDVHRQLTRNALSAGEASDASRNVLHQRGLYDTFEDDPATALVQLHRVAVGEYGTAGDIFALAELSFLYAEDDGGQPYYLASAVYAFAFLFPNGAETPPRRLDPRVRLASDLYNRAVTMALADADGEYVAPRGGTFRLPFGALDVAFDADQLTWANRQLVDFVPTAELQVDGLRQRYRVPGIGAPLAASTVQLAAAPSVPDLVGPKARIPVTALLRMTDARQQLADGRISGQLELYPLHSRDSVQIDGRAVPLEMESTSALAYSLAGSDMWAAELPGFFIGDLLAKEPNRLLAIEPYLRGRIPVVFVHGTASSPARWAQMINDLANDARLRDCFQFWMYFYDTGNPVTYSARGLRESLTGTVAALDPEGRDAALRDMVVVGHSQGGLLTKMTAIDAGAWLYEAQFRKPIDELNVSDATRQLIQDTMFVTPLPFVSRVVFISTPHRGSYLAGNFLAQWVAGFVSLPQDLLQSSAELLSGNPDALMFSSVSDAQGSIRDMTPGNSFVKALSAIPVAPGVHAHSIIPVSGDPPAPGQSDGVVKYESAHIEPIDSELIIYNAGHSAQELAPAAEEVRRILLLHLAAAAARGVSCGERVEGEETAQPQ